MTERRAIVLAGALIAVGVLLLSLSACGAGGDDAGGVQRVDAGPDETYEACRDYLERRAYGLECSPMGVEYDHCAGEADSVCYRPDYWDCMYRGLRCRADGTITEDTACSWQCQDDDSDAGER